MKASTKGGTTKFRLHDGSLVTYSHKFRLLRIIDKNGIMTRKEHIPEGISLEGLITHIGNLTN
jgi:hypothetical protein